MRIARFTVKNFKRFMHETTLELGPVTLLIGANNSGKSTFLQALNLFQYCLEVTRKRENGSGSAIVLENRTVGPEEFGTLPIVTPSDLWPQGRPKGEIGLRAEFEGGGGLGFQLKFSYNRFSISPKLDGGSDERSMLRGLQIGMIPVFTGFLPREELLTAPARHDRERQQRHGEIIRNLLWDLKENSPNQWKRLRELLGRLFPDCHMELAFDQDLQRFISANYRDSTLEKERDVFIAGSGFHQALQILSGILRPGISVALLDEPDAHLHARLQGEVMRVLAELARDSGTQFLIATHSPHLMSAAPQGSLRVCLAGRAVAFATTPEQLQVLESVGAMDRMELVPLLSNRRVVFVENRGDRKLLELFARKHWGEEKARRIFDKITFLYTYQDPVAAKVLLLARQVKDLLKSLGKSGIPAADPVRFLAIGDRDFRDASSRLKAMKDTERQAQSDHFKLELKLWIWERTEIENYLIDPEAILAAAKSSLDLAQRGDDGLAADTRAKLKSIIVSQKEKVCERVATRIQAEDKRLDLGTAMGRAKALLEKEWGDGSAWCDPKEALSSLRAWLATREGKPRLDERDIIHCMARVPTELEHVLKQIQKISGVQARKRRTSARQARGDGETAP